MNFEYFADLMALSRDFWLWECIVEDTAAGREIGWVVIELVAEKVGMIELVNFSIAGLPTPNADSMS